MLIGRCLMLPLAFVAECNGVCAKKSLINPSTEILKHHISLTAPFMIGCHIALCFDGLVLTSPTWWPLLNTLGSSSKC